MFGFRLSQKMFPIASSMGAIFLFCSTGSAQQPLSAQQVAEQVDREIEQALADANVQPAPVIGDEDFLRRISLDLTGVPPSASEVTLFSLNPDSSKRTDLIRRLLDEREFAQNWSRYWRDVIFSRATDMRTVRFQRVFETWMTQQLSENRSWDKIVTDLATATGDVSENGATALLMAHGGDAAEIAAETSRIFLGIQIQCANCHDHPTDQWKREDFHQLAAFFPRVQFRQVRDGDRRSFEIASLQVPPPGRRGPQRDPRSLFEDRDRFFQQLDRNRDGKVVARELDGSPLQRVFERFMENGDSNKDGELSLDEFKKIPAPPQQQAGRGSAEYFMPDLSDPSSQGTEVRPTFFVGTRVAAEGLSDEDRRLLLAQYLCDPENPWFAKAYVNRIWGELTGDSFYMPIDDLGPGRSARNESALNLLAEQFVAHHYDIKWLFETIAQTRAYQRAVSETSELAFASAAPSRLRSDALYDSFLNAIGSSGESRFLGQRPGGPRGFQGGARAQFSQLFGYDPSTPQSDLTGTIPQSLFFMNSPTVEGAIQSDRGMLRSILSRFDSNEDVIRELYLTVLSRTPKTSEIELGQAYVKEVGDRNEAFEDLYWALLNSSEFLTKR